MTHKKRIIHIIQAGGGVEKYIEMFLKNQKNDQYEHILVCSYEYDNNKYMKYVSAFEYVDMKRSLGICNIVKNIIQLRKIIYKYNPDIIYCHSSIAGVLGRIADMFISNKVIYNPHGWAFCMECGKIKQLMYQYIEYILAKKTDVIVAISEFERDIAIEKKICDEKKIILIYNGIDLREYDNRKIKMLNRKEIGIPDNAYIIGYVGRICAQKAPDIYIEAARRIKSHIPEAFFLMVGSGNLEKEINELIKEYKLEDCVKITGWVQEPLEYIGIFDQAMLLSRWEGFGLVLAEYMWAGKPIIATNINAIPNLITDSVNGFLVEKNNYVEVAKRSLELYLNPEKAKKLSDEGRKCVYKRFSIERVVDEHNNLFEKM